MRYLLGNRSRLPQCLIRKDFKCMVRHLKENITMVMLTEEVTGCKPACENVQLSYEKRIFMQLKPLVNRSNIAINYGNTNTHVTREILLYDFNAILSAVGGSLGLFLGFSCYQATLWLAGFVIVHLRRLCHWQLQRLCQYANRPTD